MHRKNSLSAWIKLNIIEKTKSKALIDTDINHDEFTLMINEEQICFRLKENIRAKNNQLGAIEKGRLTEHCKRIGIKEILRQNEKHWIYQNCITMISYCLRCKEDTESKNPEMTWTRNNKIILLSHSAVCKSKKSIFIKEQEAFRLLSQLGYHHSMIFCSKCIKIKNIIKKFLLAGDKFLSEMHFRQLGFTYTVYGLSTINKARIQKFKAAGDCRDIYRNELDNPCFKMILLVSIWNCLGRKLLSSFVSEMISKSKLP